MDPTIEPILVDMDMSVEEYEFDYSSADTFNLDCDSSIDVTIVRPTITVIDIDGGHRVTVEDVGSTQSFDVMDGEDGFSPTIEVFNIQNGHRLRITDANGTNTVDILDGEKGDAGFSPTINVVDIQNGHRFVIRDANGIRTVDVMDGENASPYYGICLTGTGITNKTVDISNFTINDLTVGARVLINFAYALLTDDPTLNISNTGYYPIILSTNADQTTGNYLTPKQNEWPDGVILSFIFDGSHWVLEHGTHASETNYGVTKLNSSYYSNSRNEAASSYALYSAVSALNTAINNKPSTPPGGHAGEVLVKASDNDYDVNWAVPESGLPIGGIIGDILMKRSNSNYDVEWIAPASSSEEDNTRPITAAAVYTEIGNINALLATI